MNQPNLYPFQLLDVRLFEVEVKRLHGEKPETKNKEGIPLWIHTEINNRSDKRLAYLLTIEFLGPQEELPEYKVNLTLEGMFETEENIADIELEIKKDFEDSSALSLLWPYVRECVQSLSFRMREDLPMLPTLNRLEIKIIEENADKDIVNQEVAGES